MRQLDRAWTKGRLNLALVLVGLFLPLVMGAVPLGVAFAADPLPTSVTIAGNFQSEVGCPGDWQPSCALTHLTYDASDDVWQGTFTIPGSTAAGNYEYKAPLNDSWDVNYGAGGVQGGANLKLNLPTTSAVKFYYDHKTHWVTDSKNSVIVTAAGSFQSELGCPGDWQPDCLRSLLEDLDGDGIYTFTTTNIPAGNYEAKAALNESWDVNYGAGGVPGGSNIGFTVPSAGTEITFTYNSVSHVMTVGSPQKGSLALAQAHWVSRDTIAWKVPGGAANTYRLHYDPTGALALGLDGISGGQTLNLTYDPAGLSAETKAKFPHLAGFDALKISPADLPKVQAILKGQIAVSATDATGKLLDATSIQIPGVLDDLYTYNGSLGISYQGSKPTLRVWGPTAKSVKLHLYNNSSTATETVLPMNYDAATGVWSLSGDNSWSGKFYLYEVEVYVRKTGKVEKNLVTDPYSISLSTNSLRSQIVNLADPNLKPAGWEGLKKPALGSFEDIVLYELHLRDFSISDQSVPADHRGTYLAFTDTNSNGMKHLKSLAEAGLTHLHLLPLFDFATVNENKAERQEPNPADLTGYPPDSDQQQKIISPFRDKDGFNWGYDPFHYTVPEGSYSTNPDGSTRIKEYREMVKSINETGLRVVMDVVYNHTTASGQDDKSVLDKVVPGYYHRLNLDGNVETSSCCQNTASEHNMMEKLLIDSVVTWAKDYKVDGFRFDLMGHHMKVNMVKLRDTLRSLTLAKDGVDGSKIYIYGEGWNFGEVANNARGVNATQLNMPGTGIGTFNDRLRDGVRGGGPFSGLQEQGFINGLYYDPNSTDQGTVEEQKAKLLKYMDWIRIGMAGNLRDYKFIDRTGQLVTGAQIDYNGSPAGYTLDPQEVINYVEAHDNETLFDANAFKAPQATTKADRVRMQDLGMDVLLLGQGIPFFHAGVDLLRSKSLDRDSYNSGDWFNRIDWTYQDNNFGVGLPPAESNSANWPTMKTILANSANIKPGQAEILKAAAHFREMLAVRKSSKLFRLETAAEIEARVKYYNTGPTQVAGLLVTSISDRVGADLDPQYQQVVTLINAMDEPQTFTNADFKGLALGLHPILKASSDPIVRTAAFNSASGTFTVPARTSAVFVAYQAVCSKPSAAQLKDYAVVASTTGNLSGLANLVDDKTWTIWQATSYPKAVAAEIDLGALKTLSSFQLFIQNPTKAPYLYFQYLDSAGKWSDIPGLSNSNAGNQSGYRTYDVPNITSNRFRLVADNLNYSWDVGSIGELQLCAATAVSNTASAPQSPMPHRLSVVGASASGGNARTLLDGQPWTDWVVGSFPTTASLELDLGGTKTVTSLKYYATGGASSSDTTVQYWNGSAWVNIPGLTNISTGGQGLQSLPSFSAITTGKLRFVLNNSAAHSYNVGGYGDIQVFGYAP